MSRRFRQRVDRRPRCIAIHSDTHVRCSRNADRRLRLNVRGLCREHARSMFLALEASFIPLSERLRQAYATWEHVAELRRRTS